MARNVSVELTDDLDGTPGAVEFSFSFGGREYSIDLGPRNAEKLTDFMAPYIAAARPKNGRRKGAKNQGASDAALIRAWAQENGIPVSERGRISTVVREQYHAENAA